MYRNTHATKAADLFGAGKHGFTGGSITQQIPRSVLDVPIVNDVQEELANAVESAGIALKQDTRDQLNHAICARLEIMALANHSERLADSYGGGFEDVAYGAQFVAVGSQGGIQLSNDGDAWTEIAPAAAYAATFRAVAYAAGLYLLVGNDAELQTSPDGAVYTHRNKAGGFAGAFRAVAHGGLWVVAGDNGEIQTSPDAVTFTHRSAAGGFTGTFNGAAYGNGVYVLAGDGQTQRSVDGITWTVSDAVNGGDGVTYALGLFIRVGTGGIYSSPDGITWIQRSSASAPRTIARVGYLFVGVGDGGLITVSPDGLTWRNLTRGSFSSDLKGVAYGADAFVMVGDTTTIRRSLAM
jgi:hypothetical protein